MHLFAKLTSIVFKVFLLYWTEQRGEKRERRSIKGWHVTFCVGFEHQCSNVCVTLFMAVPKKNPELSLLLL